MSGKNDLERRVDQLGKIVNLQQQMIDAQQQQLETIGPLVKELAKIGGLQKLGDMHTDQITMLATMITYLGITLTSTKAVPPEAAVAVRDAVRGHLDADSSDGMKALVKCLNIWVDHPSVSGS